MIIRESSPNDIPEIVEVLKSSLGEVDLPLTETIWRYKHESNPFGNSLVLVAEENGEIIGVRAFMAWEWTINKETFKSYRAVDTATHPMHQGKGVFKKLTLNALEKAKNSGIDLIFNTPNNQSRPGYLKMGWEIVGKIKVGIKPSLVSIFVNQESNKSYDISLSKDSPSLNILCEDWNTNLQRQNKIFTAKSASFLQWRYCENPLQQYEVFQNSELFIAGYIKKRKNISELRIAECIYRDSTSNKLIQKIIKEWCRKFGVQLVSYSPQLFKLGKFTFEGNIGPILTIKDLNLNGLSYSLFNDINNWSNSIGDLELF